MAASTLDDRRTYDSLDAEGLGGRIAGLPDQLEAAWRAGAALSLPDGYRRAERVVVLGMGGSGIGAALLAALATDLGAKTPVTVVRGYRLPAWVDARALVVASSNSGNTEETLTAFDAALTCGAMCLVATTGGRLREIAAAKGVPALVYDWRGEPRAALGWSFAALAAICARLGLVPDIERDLFVTTQAMRAQLGNIGVDIPEERNGAKQLARRFHGRLPVILGAEALAPVAYRWRTQVNENAKAWAVADELPEQNHNAQAGFGLAKDVIGTLHVVLLRHASVHPRIAVRIDATAGEMQRQGVDAEIIDVAGSSLVEQMLCAVYLGDWASYYLGLLNSVHPSPVEAIERLKVQLGR